MSDRRPIPVTEIVAALERESVNTDTDPRWLAAAELRRIAGWEARTLMCRIDTRPSTQETPVEPPCFAEKNDGVFYQCTCSKCRAVPAPEKSIVKAFEQSPRRVQETPAARICPKCERPIPAGWNFEFCNACPQGLEAEPECVACVAKNTHI